MLRSSLSVLTLLTLAACGSPDPGEAQESELVGTASDAIESCAAFDGYTAALGTRAVDCLGTLGPNSFLVDKNNNLRRNFDKCPVDQKALRDIDDLLGVQILMKEQPGGQECIAGRWQEWQKRTLASGVTTCPVWTKTGTINAPTPRLVDAYARTLPKLPVKAGEPEPRDLKVNYSYAVRFAKTPPPEQLKTCRTPATCGQICVGGLPGTWVSGQGETAVLDPLFWLIETEYTGSNPFMRAGYYHKMSFFGDDPGMVYGHRNRKGEACSRYYEGAHYMLEMEEECLIDGDLSTCMARCGSLEAAMVEAGVSP